MIKVVRVPLIYQEEELTYTQVCDILWKMQKQTRYIKNRVIQLCWEFNGFSSDYKKTYNEYPKDKEVIGKTLRGYVYSAMPKDEIDLYTSNLSASTDKAYKEFNIAKFEILKGTRSIINYNSDQPLDLSKQSIYISYSADEKEIYIQLKLFNRKAVERLNLNSNCLNFKAYVKDKSTRSILSRCIDTSYCIAGSMLIYDRRKRMWCLNLTYDMPVLDKDRNNKNVYLEKDKTLGVILDFKNPLCASVYGDNRRLVIEGGEIESFRQKTEQRRRSLLKQAKYCGDGRIGHGVKTRNKPAYQIADKIARFRNTANHKYSRAVVEYAVKNNCEIIQMENLQGVSTENKFLKNWSYYDLQTKIEQKANEYNIKVKYVKTAYLYHRCSKCGNIDKTQDINKDMFHCTSCGNETKNYYNASQNIATPKIEELIKSAIKNNK